jgi:hypothetical protein
MASTDSWGRWLIATEHELNRRIEQDDEQAVDLRARDAKHISQPMVLKHLDQCLGSIHHKISSNDDQTESDLSSLGDLILLANH